MTQSADPERTGLLWQAARIAIILNFAYLGVRELRDGSYFWLAVYVLGIVGTGAALVKVEVDRRRATRSDDV